MDLSLSSAVNSGNLRAAALQTGYAGARALLRRRRALRARRRGPVPTNQATRRSTPAASLPVLRYRPVQYADIVQIPIFLCAIQSVSLLSAVTRSLRRTESLKEKIPDTQQQHGYAGSLRGCTGAQTHHASAAAEPRPPLPIHWVTEQRSCLQDPTSLGGRGTNPAAHVLFVPLLQSQLRCDSSWAWTAANPAQPH